MALLVRRLSENAINSYVESSGTCFHCLQSIAKYVDISSHQDSIERKFCCYGCKAASEYIEGSDLGDFYSRRQLQNAKVVADNSSTGVSSKTDWQFLDDEQLGESYIHRFSNGDREVVLTVKGMYCSSCAWLVDKALARLSNSIQTQVDLNADSLVLRITDPAISLADALQIIENLGYTPRAIQKGALQTDLKQQYKFENRKALTRIAVAGFGMMQVMTYAIAMYFGDYQGMDASYHRFFSLVSLLVATVVVFYSAKPFISNAFNDLRNAHMGMDVPISIAILGAYLPSVYQVLVRSSHDLNGQIYFDSAVMFVFFLSVGRYIEMSARHRLSNMPLEIHEMLPPFIPIQRQTELASHSINIAPGDIKVGDITKLRSSMLIPFDGEIIEGNALVDESLVSGESAPISRGVGDLVVAGSKIVDGDIAICSTGDWSETFLAKMERLLRSASMGRQEIANQSSKLTQYFVTFVLIATVVVGLFWWLIMPSSTFQVVLAMLVASCPCAFSLAGPIGATAASRALRVNGILLTNFDALRVVPKVTRWCFDKTGTITRGTPTISEVILMSGVQEAQCLRLAAAIACADEHVLASAFCRIDTDYRAQNVEKVVAHGVSAEIDSKRFYLGKKSWVEEQSRKFDTTAKETEVDLRALNDSNTLVVLGDDNSSLAYFYISDMLRPQASDAIQLLRNDGADISILSGDRYSAVESVAQVLSITEFRGDLLPEQKQRQVESYQVNGDVVAMVGDGINDTPVFGQADISVAMSSGAELANANADIIILNENLSTLSYLLKVARKTNAITQQNYYWALAYNGVALPLAAAGILTPWLAALGMTLSSLIVVLNASRIK